MLRVVTLNAPETIDIAIKADGNNLTITGKHSILGDVEGAGTLDGDAINMTVTATGQMKVGFIFEGKVTGDEMAGTREIDMSNMGGGGAPGGGAPGDASGGGDRAGGPPGGG